MGPDNEVAGSTYTVGSAQLRLEADLKTALVKEGEFEISRNDRGY